MSVVLEKRYERERAKVALLERMIEDKTRELFVEHEKVQRSEQYLSRVLQYMTGGVVVTDREYKIALVNHAAELLLAQSSVQLIGSFFSEAFPVKILQMAFESERIDDLPSEQLEVVFERPSDGMQIPVACSFSVIFDERGQIEAVVCLLQDLSVMKTLERQLLQAQKLESVGQLAAGIAHEINTPIQYVRDNTVFLRDEFAHLGPLLESMRKFLEEIRNIELLQEKTRSLIETFDSIDLGYLLTEIPVALSQSLEGAESVARIVRSMKMFSHPGSEDKSHTDLNQAVESTVTVSRNEWKYVANVELHLDPELPMVQCFPGELNQVFLNLIVNAADAISEATNGGREGKGKIEISTTHSNDQVEIVFQDSGTGIPLEIRDKIFNPFFTTKIVGKGTGQGLAIVYSTVVERHRGQIICESEVGKGTSFLIRLPLA